MAIIFTDQMYVGFQGKKDSRKNGEIVLGFATYMREDKAFEKRKGTIDSWAEGYTWSSDKYDIPSEIMNNDLLTGFEISKEVRRGGWNGGNVVWRIEDPRGFELEISSSNMASIMDCCTIINGTIQGRCKWAWNVTGGSRVVLLPEVSEPYKQALEDTRRSNVSISWKEVNVGDVVELKNGYKGTYCGLLHYLEVVGMSDDSSRWYSNSRGSTWKPSTRKTHFFIDDKKNIYTTGSPKATAIINKLDVPLTAEDGAATINELLQLGSKSSRTHDITFHWDQGFVLVNPKPIKKDDWKIHLADASYEDFNKAVAGSGGDDHKNPVMSFANEYFISDQESLYTIADKHKNILKTVLVDKLKLLVDRQCITLERKNPDWKENIHRVTDLFFRQGCYEQPMILDERKFIDSEAKESTFQKLVISFNGVEYPTRLK